MRRSYDLPSALLAIWTFSVVFFVLAPLFIVLMVSLTPLEHISLPTDGISLKWFVRLAEREDFILAAINSIVLAVVAAVLALVLGVLSALALARYDFPLRLPLLLGVTSPLLVPMVMVGLAILIFFSSLGLYSQFFRLLVAHTALTLPYVVRTVSSSLAGFDPNQELAARNLGASPWRAFMLVTLPQLAPGIFAGSVFAFIVSFDNVGLSIFLTGSQFITLPVHLFSYTYYNNDPMAAAAAVVMIVGSFIAIALIERLIGLQRLMR